MDRPESKAGSHTPIMLLSLLSCITMSTYTHSAEEEWKFTLKNAYIDRDFKSDHLKDVGSWSLAASLFYTSKMQDTPLLIAGEPIKIGANASTQYAVRLSSDKHVADAVLPFDKANQSWTH